MVVKLVVCFHVCELERFRADKVIFKVTQGHCYCCRLISHILPRSYVVVVTKSLSCNRFRDIVSVIFQSFTQW